MNKAVLFAAPGSEFTMSIFEEGGNEPLDSISFNYDEIDSLLLTLVNAYNLEQLMIIDTVPSYIDGVSKQIIQILKDTDVDIIVATPGEE